MNIFLTGERQVGKSTLINKVIEGKGFKAGGFKTLPLYLDSYRVGFYIKDLLDTGEKLKYPMISRMLSEKLCEPVVDTFENEGVEILEKSLKNKPDIIIMDELGFLENYALNFQKQVKTCLDSDILVLGVIKPLNTPFLDSIREREDVRILEVTSLNREIVYEMLRQELSEVFKYY